MSGIVDDSKKRTFIKDIASRANQFDKFMKAEEDTKETFLSRIPDIFTTKDYNLLIDDIYRGQKPYPDIKDTYLDMTAKEFKAIVSKKFYDLILDEKLKPKSEMGETSSLLRTLNLALNEQKRTFVLLTPADYTSDMGGFPSEKGLDLCACLTYPDQEDLNNKDFVCILHNATLPYHIEDVIGVFKTEFDPDGKNDIYKVCPHTKSLDVETCKKLRPRLCELHRKPIRLKQDEEFIEDLPDYMERKYRSVVDQIIKDYDKSAYSITDKRSHDSKFKDIDTKAKKIAKKIFEKYDNKLKLMDYQ
ncbi:MAG: hypothetical protein KAS90_03910 [Candidatus Aenigmarchaeota archaeon]|nr:hypothetical protein [Candidatus Aenigmarchaeota archaeon]